MTPRRLRIALWICALAAGCAARPDHFYTLSMLPEAAHAASAAPTGQVLLNVTVPVVVDRREMIVTTHRSEISILDHERWAALLSDLVSQTLARDIERRRPDVMVADRRFQRVDSPPVTLEVDIVRMIAAPGDRAAIEAHWRMVDTRAGVDRVGSGSFEAPLAATGYAPVADAYSMALAGLADALAAELPRP